MPNSILYSLAISLVLALIGSMSVREHKKLERFRSALDDYFNVIVRLRAKLTTMHGQEAAFFDESCPILYEAVHKLRTVLPNRQWTRLISVFEEYKTINRNQLSNLHEIAEEIAKATLAGETALFPTERLDSFLVRFDACIRNH